jgi:hypothetical protein
MQSLRSTELSIYNCQDTEDPSDFARILTLFEEISSTLFCTSVGTKQSVTLFHEDAFDAFSCLTRAPAYNYTDIVCYQKFLSSYSDILADVPR